MAKRILVTSTDLMMVQFLLPHIMNLSENGYEVEIACSVVGGRIDEIREKLNGYVNHIIISFIDDYKNVRNKEKIF